MTARVHLEASSQGPLAIGACGIAGRVSRDVDAVTCRICQRHAPAADERIGEERRVVGGARSLPADALAIIARSRVGIDESSRARFGSWASLHELHAAVVDDGSPVRSSSDPSRFGSRVSTSARPARGVGRDDMIGIDIALERACSSGMYVGAVFVSAGEVLAVYLARTEGRPFAARIADKRKGRVTRRVACSAEDVAEQWGEGRTAHHVALLVREVRRRAKPLLVRMGLLPTTSEKESDMLINGREIEGAELVGAKAIAGHIRRSEAFVRKYTRANEDPLPARRSRGGELVVSRAALEAWARRFMGVESAA